MFMLTVLFGRHVFEGKVHEPGSTFVTFMIRWRGYTARKSVSKYTNKIWI